MTSLTTRQRDLIQMLINTREPLGIADLADHLGLSQRQVNYDLKRLENWLTFRGVSLMMKPGVGVKLETETEGAQSIEALKKELKSTRNFQLVLSSRQRYQLLAFVFLIAEEPIILNKLQYQRRN